MQRIKTARSKSKDPKQEQIREAKDHWNKEVSTLIENLIHFKKMMNGYPSKFYQQRSKIINPLPIEPSKILSIISSDFSRIVENANSIGTYQKSYSDSKQIKQASSKVSRFFSYLRGPFFGSSSEAQKRRDRIALLKYASDIYSSLKKLNSEILNRDLQSVHKSKVIFNKLTSDILTFGTFFKTLNLKEEDLKLEAPKEPIEEKIKEEDSVEREGLDNLSNEEINNLFYVHNNDHSLLFSILNVFHIFLNKKGHSAKISETDLKRFSRELGNRFSLANGTNSTIKSKRMAIEIYMRIVDRIKYELNSTLGQSPETSNAAGLYEWFNSDPSFKDILENFHENKDHSSKEKELSNEQKDLLENIDEVLAILSKHFTEKTIYSDFELNSSKNKEEYIKSRNFEKNYKNLLDVLKQFVQMFEQIPQLKNTLNLQGRAKLNQFNPSSVSEVLNFLKESLKKDENVKKQTEPPKNEKSYIDLIKEDMVPVILNNLYRRSKRDYFIKNIPKDKTLRLGRIYSNVPSINDLKEELNNLFSLDEKTIKKEYESKLSDLLHDFDLFGLDVSKVKTMKRLENISNQENYQKHLKSNKTAQISNAINWGKKKLHQVSFWNSTSPLRTKVSDYCDQGKKYTNSLMDLLEADIDPKQIKTLLKELVSLHSKIRELLSALVDLTMNVPYQGNIENLLSDRYEYDSNLDDKDTDELVKSLKRQRRTKMLRELGGL